VSQPPAGSPPRLRPVPLPELRLLEQGQLWRVDQQIAGLTTLTPVRGMIQALHHGQALELKGEAETIVTLCCDRCLQPYNHPLRAEAHELLDLAPIAEESIKTQGAQTQGSKAQGSKTQSPKGPSPISPPGPVSAEELVVGEDLDDRLDPRGRFDPERWLFEQLSLRLPLVNRCGADCPGPPSWGDAPAGIDPRWAALLSLRSR
jgi:uncharacterized protein